MKINYAFSWNEKISSSSAIILIMVLSLAVALYTVNAAEKIIREVSDSKVFNIEKNTLDIIEDN